MITISIRWGRSAPGRFAAVLLAGTAGTLGGCADTTDRNATAATAATPGSTVAAEPGAAGGSGPAAAPDAGNASAPSPSDDASMSAASSRAQNDPSAPPDTPLCGRAARERVAIASALEPDVVQGAGACGQTACFDPATDTYIGADGYRHVCQ